MSICYPSTTDWGCAYSEQKLAEMRSDPEIRRKMELSEARAWYTLAALTAWRIGVCPTLVRPVAACHAPFGSWVAAPVGGGHSKALPVHTIGALNITPYVTGGVWVNACGCGPAICGHDSLSTVYLPGPVGGIEYIKLDGEIIDPSRYAVYDGNRLVSLDPALVWPASQDLRSGPDDFGAFAVSYYQGVAPNELVASAAGYLAVEFFKSCTGDGKCRLPRKVTQVSRRGTTYEVDTGLFADGLTRIPEVDAVILMLNPNRLAQAPRIVAPELGSRRNRPTWGQW
ncbi:head-to-tail adaptor [Microbacterium phage Fransoyer]|nr:head-to-tail adaptor [Microbacterium phage SadLad]UUG69598.1 head-to-tail adaptor [Microbacterium phage Fransoyer]